MVSFNFIFSRNVLKEPSLVYSNRMHVYTISRYWCAHLTTAKIMLVRILGFVSIYRDPCTMIVYIYLKDVKGVLNFIQLLATLKAEAEAVISFVRVNDILMLLN